MLKYNPNNKTNARKLRANMTDAERMIWSHVRRKQILGIQFYRQKPIGNYIVDFYAPKAKLVIEIDGSQHFDPIHQQKDQQRDATLRSLGLQVLRFDNQMVMSRIHDVLEHVYHVIDTELNHEP